MTPETPLVEVVTAEAIQERVAQLGLEIMEEYAGRDPVLVGILQGSVVFLADLVRHLEPEIEIEFLSLTRFGHDGRVGIALDTTVPLEGRDVLIVEDIVDTGLTLTSLHRLLGTRDPASLATVTLLDKAPRRIVEVPIEFRGFEIGDEFLLGYGLDWKGRYRNLPSLWAVLDMTWLRENPDAPADRVYGAGTDRLPS